MPKEPILATIVTSCPCADCGAILLQGGGWWVPVAKIVCESCSRHYTETKTNV